MSGELAGARSTVAVALRAAGVASPEPGDPLVVPGALVRGGTPWLAPSRVGPRGTRACRLNVLLLAGAPDTTAALVILEELAERAVLATSDLAGWSTPTLTSARVVEVFGTLYLGAELELETILTIADPAP